MALMRPFDRATTPLAPVTRGDWPEGPSETLQLGADQSAMHADPLVASRRAFKGFVTGCGRKPTITWRCPPSSEVDGLA